MIKVGYVQTSPIFGDKEKNFEQIEDLLKGVKADLIVLPELFATGYTFISKNEAMSLAETTKGKTSDFLIKVSKMTKAILIGGYIEQAGDEIYNSAMIVSNDRIIDSYRKIHLYYKEKLWFSPGDKPLKVYEVNDIKIGVMICFDWIFPESIRSLALLGADIIAHPANLVLPYCQKAMITRCLENRVYSITANRIGQEKRGEDNFTFTGSSQITSSNGDVLTSAPTDNFHIGFIDIDVHTARNKQLNKFNNLIEDRRPQFYFNN
ncbi:MAG: nitrilase-related carbon-nitrogen hydrolase [Promethearchaeota archaeon]|jgi:predicted amidohydrolase